MIEKILNKKLEPLKSMLEKKLGPIIKRLDKIQLLIAKNRLNSSATNSMKPLEDSEIGGGMKISV